MTTKWVRHFNQFFTYCLKGFSRQKPEIILGNTPVFVEIDNNLSINDNHPAIQNLPKVFSSNFNILKTIALAFLTLHREGELSTDGSSAISTLVKRADEEIRKELELILPSLNVGVISAIAREKYESDDSAGYFAGFITEDTEVARAQLPGLLQFSGIDGDVLGYDSIHGHRKLLNLSSGGGEERETEDLHCLIYQRDQQGINSYRVLGTTKLIEAVNAIPVLRFISPAEWEIYLPTWPVKKGENTSHCCAVFRDGHYCLPELDATEGERVILSKKLANHLDDFPGIDPVGTAYTILQRAKKQPKGALVILAHEELMDSLCERFCRNHTAIDMRNNSPLADLCANPKALDRFAAIDGAVMTDFSGKVWAIGCIIDSVAAKGTIARGSRYNGTVGFLYQEGRRKGRPFLLALVVSEDGIVDIISSDEVRTTRPNRR